MRLRLDQVRQLLAGVKHAGLHGRGRDAKDERAIIDRLLVIVDQVDDLAVSGDASSPPDAEVITALLLQGDFRIVGAVGHGGLDGLV